MAKKSTHKEPLPDFMPKARQWGEATRFGFLRIIKAVHNCDETTAINIFNDAVESGKIIETRKASNQDGIQFYKAK